MDSATRSGEPAGRNGARAASDAGPEIGIERTCVTFVSKPHPVRNCALMRAVMPGPARHDPRPDRRPGQSDKFNENTTNNRKLYARELITSENVNARASNYGNWRNYVSFVCGVSAFRSSPKNIRNMHCVIILATVRALFGRDELTKRPRRAPRSGFQLGAGV